MVKWFIQVPTKIIYKSSRLDENQFGGGDPRGRREEITLLKAYA